jgi:hypothetical protein
MSQLSPQSRSTISYVDINFAYSHGVPNIDSDNNSDKNDDHYFSLDVFGLNKVCEKVYSHSPKGSLLLVITQGVQK